MRKTAIIPPLVLLFAVGGCVKESGPAPHDDRIVLGVEGLSVTQSRSRAAVDEWENTEVSVGYMFAGVQAEFDRSLTVTLGDVGTTAEENDGEHIETGMEYPEDNSLVSFRGYHPATTPDAMGTVTYDISKGDLDVMLSNTVTGSLAAPITQTLVFEHQLTRVTFKLRCAQNRSYPEPVFGIIANASAPTPLMTAITLALGSTSVPAFKIPGDVFCGNIDGFVIPLYGEEYVVIDMMLQPDVPLTFSVASLGGNRNIKLSSDDEGVWSELTTEGGERGVKYTVELAFSGEVILARQITATPWTQGDQDLGGGGGEWW